MALEDIIQKIEEDTAQEIARIKEETDEAVGRIIAECEQECEDILQEGRKEGEGIASANRKGLQIQARLEYQKELLGERVRLIEEVFSKVRQKILKDKKKYKVLMGKLILESAKYSNEKVVFSAKDHERFGKELATLIAEINQEFHTSNRKGELVLTNEKGDFDGGFILRRGRLNTIMTLDAIIVQCKDRYQSDVAEIVRGRKQ